VFGFCHRHNGRRPHRGILPYGGADMAFPEDYASLVGGNRCNAWTLVDATIIDGLFIRARGAM